MACTAGYSHWVFRYFWWVKLLWNSHLFCIYCNVFIRVFGYSERSTLCCYLLVSKRIRQNESERICIFLCTTPIWILGYFPKLKFCAQLIASVHVAKLNLYGKSSKDTFNAGSQHCIDGSYEYMQKEVAGEELLMSHSEFMNLYHENNCGRWKRQPRLYIEKATVYWTVILANGEVKSKG